VAVHFLGINCTVSKNSVQVEPLISCALPTIRYKNITAPQVWQQLDIFVVWCKSYHGCFGVHRSHADDLSI